jgi:hypothetical protein
MASFWLGLSTCFALGKKTIEAALKSWTNLARPVSHSANPKAVLSITYLRYSRVELDGRSGSGHERSLAHGAEP